MHQNKANEAKRRIENFDQLWRSIDDTVRNDVSDLDNWASILNQQVRWKNLKHNKSSGADSQTTQTRKRPEKIAKLGEIGGQKVLVIGDATRIAVILEVLEMTPPVFWQSVHSLSPDLQSDQKTSVDGKRGEPAGFTGLIEFASAQSDGPQKGFNEQYWFGIERLLTRLDQRNIRQQRSAKELRDYPASGPNALADYEDFVRGLEPRHQPFAFQAQLKLTRDRERDLKQIQRALFDTTSKQRLLNVHGHGMWRGLSAAGMEITKRFTQAAKTQGDARRVLYLPLRSHARKTSERSPGSLTFAQALGYIHHFYCHDLAHITDAKPLEDDSQILEILNDIRLAMIKRPRVLVLDGVFVRQTANALDGNLMRNIIADRALISLITNLIELPLSSITNKEELERYRQNRIIVLSNDPIAGGDLWPSAISPKIEKSWLLQQPAPEDGPAILTSYEFVHEDVLLATRVGRTTALEPWSDCDYFIFEGILSAAHRAACPYKPLTRIDPDLDQETYKAVYNAGNAIMADAHHLGRKPDELSRNLIDDLVSKIMQNDPVQGLVLFIIAAIPEGARRKTLDQIFDRVAKQPAGLPQAISGRDQGASHATRKSGFHKALEALCADFPTILCEVDHDYFRGFDTFGNGDTADTAAISFVLPEMRIHFEDALASELFSDSMEGFHLIHRHLCDICLRQQTFAMRHTDLDNVVTLRPLRRQISAIYHGLKALPINRHTANALEFVPLDLASVEANLPTDTYALWRYIYFFLYRRMLERPPAFNVSRKHGNELFKLEVLTFMDAPYRLWPQSLQEQLPRGFDSGVFSSARGDNDVLPDQVIRDFVIAKVQTQLLLGRKSAVVSELSQLEPLGWGNAGDDHATVVLRKFSVIKRKLDHGILLNRDLDAVRIADPKPDSVVEQDLRAFLIEVMGTGFPLLLKTISATAQNIDQLLTQPVGGMDALPDTWTEGRKIVEEFDTELSSAALISSTSDILYRIAESIATRADMNVDISVPEVIRRAGAHQLWEASDTPDARRLKIFSAAFAICLIAESLRLDAFRMEPSSSNFFGSGRAIRIIARIAIRLGAIRQSNINDDAVPNPFFASATNMLDTLTRHSWRYSPERAKQLIVESSILRRTTNEKTDVQNMVDARNCLQVAERIIFVLGNGDMPRRRLALERSKLHFNIFKRGLSDPALPDPDLAFVLADVDLKWLKKSVKADDAHDLWPSLVRRLAADQGEKSPAEKRS